MLPCTLYFCFLITSYASTGESSVDNLCHSCPVSASLVNETASANYAYISVGLANNLLDMSNANTYKCKDRKRLLDEQSSLHLHLKEDMPELCKILQLSVSFFSSNFFFITVCLSAAWLYFFLNHCVCMIWSCIVFHCRYVNIRLT